MAAKKKNDDITISAVHHFDKSSPYSYIFKDVMLNANFFKNQIQLSNLYRSFSKAREKFDNIFIIARDSKDPREILLCEGTCLWIIKGMIGENPENINKNEINSINSGLERIMTALEGYGNIDCPEKYVYYLLMISNFAQKLLTKFVQILPQFCQHYHFNYVTTLSF